MVFITWIENTSREEIDFPKGWSVGILHTLLASGAKEAYMCGFDGGNYSEPINNIYKGSKNYLPADSRLTRLTGTTNLNEKGISQCEVLRVGTELTYEELKITYDNIRRKHVVRV